VRRFNSLTYTQNTTTQHQISYHHQKYKEDLIKKTGTQDPQKSDCARPKKSRVTRKKKRMDIMLI
jgi:hypothetical protein